MATRGPKKKTAANSRPKPPLQGWDGFAPPDLDPVAQAAYARLVAALRHRGTLEKTDPSLVVAAARTLSLIERAESEIASAPELTLTTANGTLMPHPASKIANMATQRLRGLMRDLGLTLATARLSDPKAVVEDAGPWKDLLNVVG